MTGSCLSRGLDNHDNFGAALLHSFAEGVKADISIRGGKIYRADPV